jgi:hypothetical protein
MYLFRRIALFLVVIGFLAILSACSGSSGSPPVLNYSGETKGVVIDAENAEALLAGAYEGGQTATVLNIFGAVQVDAQPTGGTPRLLALAGTFDEFLSGLDLGQPVQYAGAIITDSETLPGSCGGEVYYDVSIDSIFGDFSGTADFREYCDKANPDLVLDGITEFYGDYDLLTLEIDDFSFIFRGLTGITDAGSFTLDGSMNGNVSTTRAYVKANAVLTDNTTQKDYWLKDFEVTAVKGLSFLDLTVTGRYYDYDYGYVDVSTEEPFRLYDSDDWPASGILLLTGGEGSAGGSTMARLVVIDSSSYEVEADTDGDGEFDDYYSGPLLWDDM